MEVGRIARQNDHGAGRVEQAFRPAVRQLKTLASATEVLGLIQRLDLLNCKDIPQEIWPGNALPDSARCNP